MLTDDIAIIIAISIVVGLLLFLQLLINTDKQYRGRQAVLPPVAFVYCAVFIIVVFYNYDRISLFAKENPTPLTSGSLAIFLNMLIFIGFLIVKGIVCSLADIFWEEPKLMEITSSNFYFYDDGYSNWFLKRDWVNFRQMCKVFVFCIAAVCVGYIFAAGKNTGNTEWVIYFPCAVLIIVGEIWHFLSGFTKEEFQHKVVGDDADTRRIGQYYRIREIYEKIFAPQVLTAHTVCEFSGRYGLTEMIKNLSESNSPIDNIIANYFNLTDEGIFPDADYIQATSQLMHRKSVVFFDPFYRDLSIYITLPIINALLGGKRCLVITGRSSSCGDVKTWLADMIKQYSRMESLWRVAELSTGVIECEVGILSLMQLYDLEILKNNRQFFNDTDFIFLIEPSVIINTGQVGLSMITDEMRKREDKPVYCICDRKTEGLVDTLSHLLYTEITDVIAMPPPRCMSAAMAWNADGDFIRQQLFDKQTKFLGNGIELAAVAVKNQIPKVTWYSETKAPVRDIKWITGQYHPAICRYMNLFGQQNNIYERISFVANLWSAPVESEQFIIAEDEFCNMFGIMRAYLSRGIDQVFINILSENYLLRDYMRYNRQMFTSDPSAIPSVVPDYAKTERNSIFKLLLYMAYRPVTEAEVISELSLVDITVTDTLGTLSNLLRKYTYIDESIFTVQSFLNDDAFGVSVTNNYSIPPGVFEKYFANSLKNAYYLVEDEERDAEYIDGKLFGHITQQILPGQFVTYDGKYYLVKLISPTGGVVLRRASDLYDGRKYYRQLRTYKFETMENIEIISLKKVIDVEIAFIRHNFSVITAGYLDMKDNNDLRSARLIDLTSDPSTERYIRGYKNKTVMRLMLPETNDNIRFTICMLLSEAFRSIFPNSWHYIAVVSKRPKDIGGILNYLAYQLDIDADDEHIYIIEDSDMDLGLLEAIERNLHQFMEIITDFLDWHFDKMKEPEYIDPVIGEAKKPKEEARRGLFIKMADNISKLFGIKKEEVEIVHTPETEELPDQDKKADTEQKANAEQKADAEHKTDETEAPGYNLGKVAAALDKTAKTVPPDTGDADTEEKSGYSQQDETMPDEDAEYLHIDGTDIFDDEGTSADNEWLEESFKTVGIVPVSKTRYQNECFLKFGFDEIDKRIQLEDVRNYMRTRGYSDNPLTKARKRDVLARQPFDFNTSLLCAFCGQPLTGVSYEKLTDGRLRCNTCSLSAISSAAEFKDLFFRVLGMMEGLYNISFKVPISVKMTDKRSIDKSLGIVFKPGTEAAGRVLGYAKNQNGNYNIFLENGSPYLAAIDLIVHELTHIWQFINWKDKVADLNRLYNEGNGIDHIYEGMSMWASIQYLYQIGETYYAELQESIAEKRIDIYGTGFRLYRERYPFIKDSSLLKYSPFSTYPPL